MPRHCERCEQARSISDDSASSTTLAMRLYAASRYDCALDAAFNAPALTARHAAAPCRTSGPFEFLARKIQAGSDGARHLAQRHRAGFALSRLRPAHRQHRSRPARVRANLYRIFRPHGAGRPDFAGSGATQEKRRHVCARRTAIWRAGRGHRRVLGPRKRFRRQSGQGQFDPLDRHARLRLPPRRHVSRTSVQRAEAARPRRSRGRRRWSAHGPANSARPR